jgi:hypothetical protein
MLDDWAGELHAVGRDEWGHLLMAGNDVGIGCCTFPLRPLFPPAADPHLRQLCVGANLAPRSWYIQPLPQSITPFDSDQAIEAEMASTVVATANAAGAFKAPSASRSRAARAQRLQLVCSAAEGHTAAAAHRRSVLLGLAGELREGRLRPWCLPEFPD